MKNDFVVVSDDDVDDGHGDNDSNSKVGDNIAYLRFAFHKSHYRAYL